MASRRTKEAQGGPLSSDGLSPAGKSHLFQKGQSGNPGGKPKALKEVLELARQHTPAAIAALARNLDDPNGAVSNAAAVALLDRGWGKPQSTFGEDGAGETVIAQALAALLARKS